MTAWQPFPLGTLPDVAATYIAEAATAIGCDPSMVALPTLTVGGTAVGTTRQVRIKRAWAEPCVLWTVIVARPSTLKSPAHDLGVEPLRRIQAARFRDHATAVAGYDRAKAEYEAAYADWKRKPTGKRGDPPEQPVEPACVRHMVSDVTIEAIAPILLENPRGVGLFRDELSNWFASFDRYTSGAKSGGKGGGDVASWLEMHRAGPVLVDRKTGVRRIYVPRAAVSIAGTIQPDTLRGHLTPPFFANGLAARLLLGMPPTGRKQWREADVSERTCDAWSKRLAELVALRHRVAPSGEPLPVDVRFTSDARRVWVAWYDECAAMQADAADVNTEAALGKIEGVAARLALVCQLVRNPAATVIDVEAIRAGATLARWFANEATRVYARLTESPEDRERRQLLELIERKGGTVTLRGLMRASRRFPTADLAEIALIQLVRDGLGVWAPNPTNGRATRVFRLISSVGADTSPENSGDDGLLSTSALSTTPEGETKPDGGEGEAVQWTA